MEPGEGFAFVAERANGPCPGDVLYGEVLEVLPDARFIVRVQRRDEDESGIEEYEACCLTERISRAAIDRTASAGWLAK